MPPKKGGKEGDAGKGEKIYKNLCAVCHSLSVSFGEPNRLRSFIL